MMIKISDIQKALYDYSYKNDVTANTIRIHPATLDMLKREFITVHSIPLLEYNIFGLRIISTTEVGIGKAVIYNDEYYFEIKTGAGE